MSRYHDQDITLHTTGAAAYYAPSHIEVFPAIVGNGEQLATMKKRVEKIPVTGGWVKRDANTGRFMEVATRDGVTKASEKTRTAVREASSKRNAALKRLANR